MSAHAAFRRLATPVSAGEHRGMAFVLAYVDSPVPAMPPPGVTSPSPPSDQREHFGTREAALRRAAAMMPAAPWRRLRLFGPDGALIADQPGIVSLIEAEPHVR